MKITNLNPAEDVGASAWLVELDGRHLLLDAGVHPKLTGRASLPLFRKLDGIDLDAIAISHCHLDHVGALPVVLRRHPRAQVWMTDLSYFLVERVLHNSVNVMIRQRDEAGVRDYPLFSHDEVEDIAPVFEGVRYNRAVEWAVPSRRGDRGGLTLEFLDSGHTLGSAGILVQGARQRLFYSGDVCFRDQTLLKGARFGEVAADVLILETTRGQRAGTGEGTRARELERLLACIRTTLQRKGTVLIPAFALGRTQEMLAQLALWMSAGKLRRQPVFIGGLGRVFSEIYDLQAHRTHRHHPRMALHEALTLEVLEPAALADLKPNRGRLCVLTSGMMVENTAAHDLALRLFTDARHAICFVGYADPDTPGGRLKASLPGQPFLFSAETGQIRRACEVHDFDLTAHADREELIELVERVNPRAVILGHGDPAARAWFERELKERRPRLRVLNPRPGEQVQA
jgi:Cft2 family RNA processing exonuclease